MYHVRIIFVCLEKKVIRAVQLLQNTSPWQNNIAFYKWLEDVGFTEVLRQTGILVMVEPKNRK
jgi:hypothetical protein